MVLREVSEVLRSETALLKNLSHPKRFTVRKQNFDYDLLSPQKLLEKYVGRKEQMVRNHPQTGAEILVEVFGGKRRHRGNPWGLPSNLADGRPHP